MSDINIQSLEASILAALTPEARKRLKPFATRAAEAVAEFCEAGLREIEPGSELYAACVAFRNSLKSGTFEKLFEDFDDATLSATEVNG
jgi:hypothetical protein